jgi:hypothetical protein
MLYIHVVPKFVLLMCLFICCQVLHGFRLLLPRKDVSTHVAVALYGRRLRCCLKHERNVSSTTLLWKEST